MELILNFYFQIIYRKFKPDKNSVNAVCALDSSNVLTASNCIKWWNWDNKTLLKKFSGHATEIRHLKHVKIPDNENVFGSYFLSSAVGDRLINAWFVITSKLSHFKLIIDRFINL